VITHHGHRSRSLIRERVTLVYPKLVEVSYMKKRQRKKTEKKLARLKSHLS